MPKFQTQAAILNQALTAPTAPMSAESGAPAAPNSPPAEPTAATPAPVADVPAVQDPIVEAPLIQFDMDTYTQGQTENSRRDFMARVLAARKPVVKEYVPPKVPAGIAENTRLEMEAGARQVAIRAAEEALRPKRQVEHTNSVAVFRPNDYIPDQKKMQGNTNARAL